MCVFYFLIKDPSPPGSFIEENFSFYIFTCNCLGSFIVTVKCLSKQHSNVYPTVCIVFCCGHT